LARRSRAARRGSATRETRRRQSACGQAVRSDPDGLTRLAVAALKWFLGWIYPLQEASPVGGGAETLAMFTYDPSMPLLNFDAEIGPYDPQHFRAQFESETGQKIYAVVTSRDGRLAAALATRRKDPVAPELEPFIAVAAGPESFEDRYKQYTGHLIRHVVACMGGRIRRKGVDVTTPGSRYTHATSYELASA